MIRIDELLWDERAEDHIARHGVTLDEVEQAVENHIYARRSRDYLLVIGQTNSGRYLTTVLDHEGGNTWYPVTARATSRNERRMLRRQTTSRR